MASTRLKVTGLNEILARLKTLEGRVAKKHVRGSLRKGLAPVKKQIAENAPVGETGELSKPKNIKIRSAKRSKKSIGVTVGYGSKDWVGKTWYAAAQEYGTSKMQNHPGRGFMRKAYDEKKQEASRVIIDDLTKRIDKEIGQKS